MKRLLFLPLLLLATGAMAQSHNQFEPHYKYPQHAPWTLNNVMSKIRNYYNCDVNGNCGTKNGQNEFDNGTVFSWISTELVSGGCKIKSVHREFDLVRGQITINGNPVWVNLFENHRAHCSLTRAVLYPPWYCGQTH